MRTLGRSIAGGVAGLAMGLGLLIAPAGAASTLEPADAAVEANASWTYYDTYTSETNCLLMSYALRNNGTAKETTCQFYPGNQHVWKLYYR